MVEANHINEAIVQQEQIVAAQRQEPDWQYASHLRTLADLYEKSGRMEDALEIYRQVLELRQAQYDPEQQTFVDSFESGEGFSFNESEMQLHSALADYHRCLELVMQSYADLPESTD